LGTTERLYYAPGPPRAFDAIVRRVEARADGAAVWLDRTAFYPTSGGQPHDLGTLNGIPVQDVVDDEQGEVMHVVASSGFSNGARVHGEIDWGRRLDHVQQHTGQHLVSAALEHAFGARTVSFHLGAGASTIDLDRELTPQQIAAGEVAANRAVWDDRVVSVRYVTEQEARQLPLRKESVRIGTLRLIDIDGIDLSACGGTHVQRTGEIGQIAVSSWERFKGGQRIEFLCGGRALVRFQQLRDASAAAVRLLSVLPSDLPEAIGRLQSEAKEQARALSALQQELAVHEAATLASAAEPLPDGGGRMVLRSVAGDALRLKTLAVATARKDIVTVLVSDSTPALAVAARGPALSLSCQSIVAALTTQFGGRGGGKPDLAQCGGLQGTPEAILDAARAVIGSGR
jgi:alanyl-tRNA synthetase